MSGKRTTTVGSVVVLIILIVIGYFLTREEGSEPPSPTGAPTSGPAAPGDDPAAQLAALTVAPEGKMTGYSRDRFPHWSSQGDSCDTREVVLQRQGTDVQTDSACKATSGTWTSAYDGVVVEDAGKLDIDHTVALAEAWRSGADKWTDEERGKFANDLGGLQLIAVTASSNRSKGDQDAAKWKPPAESYWCTYARAVVSVKTLYSLTVDEAERDALATMLKTC
ncbi:HNH endonuclease family protein [Saccharothrix longispora]|uniref:HNH endonuclease family protein n=1 Tax=Saccharothrix longispora TaxID=33920 RepID=UPI0028FD33D2|nr:HNH endonuclease family protein [Saccharothrix longispora]MBY8849903.1 HNH endonuclease family protein [Saccharothrix sp. MB29]MDU0294462.1 HNH endonuclease family protein [Saccharothrix longispora]